MLSKERKKNYKSSYIIPNCSFHKVIKKCKTRKQENLPSPYEFVAVF